VTGNPLSGAQKSAQSKRRPRRSSQASETQDYLQKLLARKDQRLEELLDKSLDAIERGLEADDRDSDDHQAQMRAAAEFSKILTLRAGRKDGSANHTDNFRFRGTLEELLLEYKRIADSPAE
jgi:hypothetical protein